MDEGTYSKSLQTITVTVSPYWIVILSVHFNLRYMMILSGEVLHNVTGYRNTGHTVNRKCSTI